MSLETELFSLIIQNFILKGTTNWSSNPLFSTNFTTCFPVSLPSLHSLLNQFCMFSVLQCLTHLSCLPSQSAIQPSNLLSLSSEVHSFVRLVQGITETLNSMKDCSCLSSVMLFSQHSPRNRVWNLPNLLSLDNSLLGRNVQSCTFLDDSSQL